MHTNLDEKVFLLGFGAQKSGTSWMANYLKSHPEIFVSSIKEMHFFEYYELGKPWPDSFFEKQIYKIEASRQQNQNQVNRLIDLYERLAMANKTSAYKNFFAKRMTDEKLFCEITPAYAFLPLSELQRIRKNFEHLKIIYIMRNPVDRFWSQIKSSNPNLSIGQELEIIEESLLRDVYLKRSNYKLALENIWEVFPQKDTYIEFFENIFSDRTIRDLCRFLDVDYKKPNITKKRNSSFEHSLPDTCRKILFHKLKLQYDFAQLHFPNQIPRKWLDDLDKLNH